MPFFGSASDSEANGSQFWDVGGDMSEYQHGDYSMRTAGQNNVVTQHNRPAMISTGEGSHVTIHVYSDHRGFHGNTYLPPTAPLPSSVYYPMCPEGFHYGHPQYFPSQPANYESNVSPLQSSLTGSFYAPAPAPMSMPAPSTPFNPTPRANRESPPVQMPVPASAPTLAGTGMPSASHHAGWNVIPTTTGNRSSNRQPASTYETQPGFIQPAIRFSVPRPHWSPPSDQLQSPIPCMSAEPPPRASGVSFPPLFVSLQQGGGPTEGTSLKHVPNTRPPSHSLSASRPLLPQRDTTPRLFNQNLGRSQTAPVLQWTTDPTWPSETEGRGVHETGSFTPSAELPQQDEEMEEDPSVLDVSPPKKLRRRAEVTRAKQRD